MSVCLNLVYTIIFNSLGIPNFVNINQSDFFFIRLEIHKEWYISSLTKEKKIISILYAYGYELKWILMN